MRCGSLVITPISRMLRVLATARNTATFRNCQAVRLQSENSCDAPSLLPSSASMWYALCVLEEEPRGQLDCSPICTRALPRFARNKLATGARE